MGNRSRGMALVLRALACVPRSAPVAAGLGAAAAGVVLFTGSIADGKSSYDSHYGYERTWNAVLRFVRVDLGFKILEKDEKNGFLLFEYRTSESQKTSSGSLELVRGGGTRPDDVRVVAQLAQMPRYHEQVLLDGLAKKMREDYGPPPEPRVVPPAPPPDAGPPEGTPDDPNEEGDQK